jgi:hypothetical protein
MMIMLAMCAIVCYQPSGDHILKPGGSPMVASNSLPALAAGQASRRGWPASREGALPAGVPAREWE